MSTLAHYEHLANLYTWKDGKPYRTLYTGQTRVAGCITGQGYRVLTSTVDGQKVKITAQRLRWFMAHGWPVPTKLRFLDSDKDNNRIGNLIASGKGVMGYKAKQ